MESSPHSTASTASLAERIDTGVRREQAARARGFGWGLMAVTAGATVASLALGGDYSVLRIAWLFSLSFLFGVSAHVVRTFRPPDLGRLGVVGLFGVASVVAGLLSTAYLGVFSPAPLVVTTGIAFFGQARSRWISQGTCFGVIGGTVLLGLWFTIDPSADPGIVAATKIDPGWRVFFLIMVPFVMLTAWWQARVEIHARVSRVEKLSEAVEAAEAAGRTKSRFLANMSHEIRTPLNGISGMTALLAQEVSEPRHLERIDVIRDGAASLLRILNDVLDSAQLEAGELLITPEPFDLLAVVDGVLGTLGPAAHEKNIELVSIVDPGVEGRRLGDEGRIRQILLNLVHNALKFTDAGHVTVVVSPSVGDDVAFVVNDTGSGIERELRQAVFDPFTQADDSSKRRFGGSGLGLAIARRLAERMGGSLNVETSLGIGSSFALRVPLPTAESPSSRPQPGATRWPVLENLSVKLAVEQEQLRTALHAWFEDRGARVRKAGETGEATGPLLSIASVVSPTGEARLSLIGAGRQTGVGLPLRWGRLHQAVRAVLGPATDQASTAQSGVAALRLSGLILVVDDNEVNLMVARGMLEAAGAQVLTAASAAAARPAIANPELRAVLMDVQMPVLDGLAFTRQLRAQGFSLPIVGFTAHADDAARARCLAAGMSAYVAKPVQQAVLLSTLRGLMGGD